MGTPCKKESKTGRKKESRGETFSTSVDMDEKAISKVDPQVLQNDLQLLFNLKDHFNQKYSRCFTQMLESEDEPMLRETFDDFRFTMLKDIVEATGTDGCKIIGKFNDRLKPVATASGKVKKLKAEQSKSIEPKPSTVKAEPHKKRDQKNQEKIQQVKAATTNDTPESSKP